MVLEPTYALGSIKVELWELSTSEDQALNEQLASTDHTLLSK